VLHHQHVEDVARRTGRRSEVDDLGVVDRELRDLLLERGLDEETVTLPEVGVLAEHTSEHHQEGRAHVGGALLEGDPLDAPTLVHQVEERFDVVTHDVLADVGHDLVDTCRQPIAVAVQGRSEVGVQLADDLEVGHGRDHLVTHHALVPAHTAGQHEAVVGRQPVQHRHGLHVMLQVSQQDVRAELQAVLVEDAEALALPLLGGVEVDGRTEVRPLRCTALHEVDPRADALESIHDEDGVLEVEHTLALDDALSAHAELDVRGTGAVLVRLDQVVDPGQGQDLALVGRRLEVRERVRVDHAAKDDLVTDLVESPVDDLDAVGAGSHASFLSLCRSRDSMERRRVHDRRRPPIINTSYHIINIL
jgi:hypothetical protein